MPTLPFQRGFRDVGRQLRIAANRLKHVLAMALTATLAAGFLVIPQQPAQAAPVDCSRGVNLGFETPLVRSSPMGPFPNWALVNESLVTGWSTTASDDLIELWESTFLGVTSYAGGQHAELNATQPSTLSQNFATLGGDSIAWTVAHRGRTGPDTADVRFGPPGTPTLVQVMTSPAGAWSVYSGTYVVPPGQTTTQISFASQNSGSLGNFLDGIQLSLVCDISISTTFTGFTDVDFSGHINPGDTAAFEYLVENLGTATVQTLQVSDSLGFLATCPVTTLMPGQSTTCTGAYVLTAAEVDGGAVTSDATATAQDAAGVVVSDTDSVTEPIASEPGITLDKSAALNDSLIAPSGRVDTGDAIDYTLTVTNTGNVTLDPVAVTDDTAGTVSCPGTSLASGEVMACTATLVLSQADIDAGSVSNTASADGSFGVTVVSDGASANVVLDAVPGISVIKVGNIDDAVIAPVGRTDAGDVANYTITVTNTGNVTLDPIVVTDPLAPPVSCPADALGPGGTMDCTASLTLDQSAIDAGSFTNTVTARGNPAGSDPGDPGDDVTSTGTEALDLTGEPLIGIAKNLEQAVISADGTIQITFRYTVENFGNVTLTDLILTDDVVTIFAGLSPQGFATADGTLIGSDLWDGSAGSNLLAPGQSLTPGQTGDVFAVFSITASMEASVDNIAGVLGTSPGGVDVADDSINGTDPDPDGDGDPTNNTGPTTVTVPNLYDLQITKTGGLTDPDGTAIQWVVTVTNIGPGDVTGPITVVDTAGLGLQLDSASGTGWSCEVLATEATCSRAEGLAAGATTTILISSTAAMVNGSPVTNSAALELVGSGDLDPSNNAAISSVFVGDLPFTGFGSAPRAIIAAMLCTLGLVMVWRERRRVTAVEPRPRRQG